MGDYSRVYIGKYEIMNWKWDLPPSNDEFLTFIFEPGDKKVVKVSKKNYIYKYYSDKNCFTCRYDIPVKIALERLKDKGFSSRNLVESLSNLTGIPKRHVPYAIVDYSELYDVLRDKEQGAVLKRILSNQPTGNSFEKYNKMLYNSDLGLLSWLMFITTLLENTDPEDLIVVDMSETLGVGGKKTITKRCNNIALFDPECYSIVHLNGRYLDLSMVHYSERKVNLVYMDLVIALEISLKSYLQRRKSGLEFNLDEFLKNVSLTTTIKFVFSAFEDRPLEPQVSTRLDQIYNIRNNTVHSNMKRYEVERIPIDIETVRSVVYNLEQLSKKRRNRILPSKS